MRTLEGWILTDESGKQNLPNFKRGEWLKEKNLL